MLLASNFTLGPSMMNANNYASNENRESSGIQESTIMAQPIITRHRNRAKPQLQLACQNLSDNSQIKVSSVKSAGNGMNKPVIAR